MNFNPSNKITQALVESSPAVDVEKTEVKSPASLAKMIDQKDTDDIREYLDPEHKWYGDFFSVGSLCLFSKEKIRESKKSTTEITQGQLAAWWKEYASTHLAANPKARDFSTKQVLLADAEKRFLCVGVKLAELVTVNAYHPPKG